MEVEGHEGHIGHAGKKRIELVDAFNLVDGGHGDGRGDGAVADAPRGD